MPVRFPSPWTIQENTESFAIKDAKGQVLCYVYFEDEPQRRSTMRRMTKDDGFLLAVAIAKLPSVPRQILRDIPRPAAKVSGE